MYCPCGSSEVHLINFDFNIVVEGPTDGISCPFILVNVHNFRGINIYLSIYLLPLSAGKITMFLLVFKLFIAFFALTGKLLFCGLALFKILDVSIPDSILAIISSTGTVSETTAKFPPLAKIVVSSSTASLL